MACYSNRCKCYANSFGISSSESTVQCYYNKHNVQYCNEPFNFICERNCTILRKICNNIFKEFIRSKHREKYTIFDGGNSIKVKIQRSSSRDNGNLQRHKNNSQNYLHRARNKIDYFSKNENPNYRKNSDKNFSNRLYEYHYDENDLTKANKRKIKSRNWDDNKADENDTESIINRKGKKKSGRRAYRDNDTKASVRNKKRSDRYENDSDESNSNIPKNGNENPEKRASNKAETKTIVLKQVKLNNDFQDKKIRSKKNIYKNDSEYNEGKYARKGKNQTGSLPNDKKGSLDKKHFKYNNRTVEEKHLKNKNLPVIRDLRNKVRRGQKIFFDSESRKSKNFMNQKGKIRPSRADEVKSSDLLRAQMEQRDFW